MSYTAKSVILDIADNYGSTVNVGIRLISFYYQGALIENGVGYMSNYATSYPSNYFLPENAWDTDLSRTGSAYNNSWLSAGEKISNQRLIAVFDTTITFDQVYVNNYHDAGSETNRGAKNIKLYISSDSITNTTYNATITNSELIYSGVVNQHINLDISDDQRLPIGDLATTEITTKSVILDIANNHGDTEYVGLREVDFYYKLNKLPLTTADYTAYSTSQYNSYFSVNNIFNTSKDLTGDSFNSSWFSSKMNTINQRVIVVFNTPQTFDEIVVNNFHSDDSYTNRGAKNVKIYASDDSITNTIYDSYISNAITIFDSQFPEHSNFSPDNVSLELTLPESIKIDVDSGSYSISGNSNGLGLGISPDTGEFNVSGSIIGTNPLLVQPDSYIISSNDLTSFFPDPLLTIGSYAMSGSTSTLNLALNVESGVYDAMITLSIIDVDSGTYLTSGAVARIGPGISAYPGESNITWNNASVIYEEQILTVTLPRFSLDMSGGKFLDLTFSPMNFNSVGYIGASGALDINIPKILFNSSVGGFLSEKIPSFVFVATASLNNISDLSILFTTPKCSIIATDTSAGNINLTFPKLQITSSGETQLIGNLQTDLLRFVFNATALPGNTCNLSCSLSLWNLVINANPTGPGAIISDLPKMIFISNSNYLHSIVLHYSQGHIS